MSFSSSFSTLPYKLISVSNLYCLVLIINRLRDDINARTLTNAALIIIGGPSEPFSKTEIQEFKNYLERGGNILYLNQENAHSRNFNFLLEEYGMFVNEGTLFKSFLSDIVTSRAHIR